MYNYPNQWRIQYFQEGVGANAREISLINYLPMFCWKLQNKRNWTEEGPIDLSFQFFHNSCLIRRIGLEKNTKKIRDLTRDWTKITCLAVRALTITLECFLCLCEAVIECYSCMGDSVSHSNHYTRMLSVLVWDCNWILFMHGWFCQPL